MRAELVLFGRRVNMAQQARRRVLVVAIYAAMLGLIGMLWYFTHWRGTGAYVIWAAIGASKLFLGGHYRGGLVKPFRYRQPVYADSVLPYLSLLALKLRVYESTPDWHENEFRNDERELHQRDRAHYQAYQIIGFAVILPMFIASMRLIKPALVPISISSDELYYGLALLGAVLFVTLPQCILLWTEPDMEAEFPQA